MTATALKLKSTLPQGFDNGLTDVLEQVLKDPHSDLLVVMRLGDVLIERDADDEVTKVTLRIGRAEPIAGDLVGTVTAYLDETRSDRVSAGTLRLDFPEDRADMSIGELWDRLVEVGTDLDMDLPAVRKGFTDYSWLPYGKATPVLLREYLATLEERLADSGSE